MLPPFNYFYYCRGLPAKTPAEEKRHQKLYQEMIQATKRKGNFRRIITSLFYFIPQSCSMLVTLVGWSRRDTLRKTRLQLLRKSGQKYYQDLSQCKQLLLVDTCTLLSFFLSFFLSFLSLPSRSRKDVRELWWLGLPPGVRGTVWKKAIGNDLNISRGK